MSIKAVSLGMNKVTVNNWKTDWGSFDKDFMRMQHVEVSATPWGSGNAIEGALEIIWFGRELVTQGTGRRIILRRESKPFKLASGVPIHSFLFSSGLVEGSMLKLRALGIGNATGAKIEGWYVRAVGGGKNLHDAASHTYLADIGRDGEKLGQLLDASQ